MVFSSQRLSPQTILRLVLCLLAALGVIGSASVTSAQSGAGAIQGTVTDPTGAAISGAAIHVVNLGSGVKADAISNSTGFYQVPGLFTGKYSLAVTAPNMKRYESTIQLQVSQTAVINPVMRVGSQVEQVVVSGDVVQLTTPDSGSIGQTLENERINQLPENGRSLPNLIAMTTPGLDGNSPGGTMLNGIQGGSVSYVADGVPLDNRQFGGVSGYAQTPDPDAVQEVRIQTTNANAEFSSPGTVVITTKSGSNRIHGSVFETARNNAFGIAKSRQDPANFAAPQFIRNEFGASAGGPVVIPHLYHGKDKTFWFVAYERYSLAQAQSFLYKVPTAAMRNGDFSALLGLPNPVQLYDPSTTYNAAVCPATGKPNPFCRQPFANDQIPVTRESPVQKIINDNTPLPNLPGNPFITPNLVSPNKIYVVIPTWTFRLDQAFSEANHAYLRFTSNNNRASQQRSNLELPLGGADGFANGFTGLARTPTTNYAAALGFTHVFSPTFFAETILGNQWFSQKNGPGGPQNIDYEQKLGLPNNFGETGFPSYGEPGSLLLDPTYGTQFGYGESQIVTNLDENLTKTLGHHQLHFGARYRHERFGYAPDTLPDRIQFTNLATSLYNPATGVNYGALPNIGNQNADAFLGAAAVFRVAKEPPYEHIHDMELDGYFQDDFHVTRNLTLNLGLRYEAHPAPVMDNGVMATFDLKNDALALARSPQKLIDSGLTTQPIIANLQAIGAKLETFGQAGIASSGFRSYDATFGPRFGIAYLPFGGGAGTVIRGGYGRYIYAPPVRTIFDPIAKDAPFSTTYSLNLNSVNQSPDGRANYLLRKPQPLVLGVNSANVVNTDGANAILPGGADSLTNSPDFPPTYVTESNVTLEQPLKGHSVLRVSWVWTHGTNLMQTFLFNNHPSNYTYEMQTGNLLPKGTVIGSPNYAATAEGPYDQTTWGGGMSQIVKSGWSNDNALQVNLQRLYNNGFAYQAYYIWSKPMRAGSDYQLAANQTPIYPVQNYFTSGLGTMTPLPNSSAITAPNTPPSRSSNLPPYEYGHSLNRFESYQLDPNVPIHAIHFNAVADLPFGKGKKFFGSSNRLVNELIGGFQLATLGSVTSQDFGVDSSHWGPMSRIHVYRHSRPVTDCRSGTCLKAYQWFNGYIAPSALPSSGCQNVVSGIHSDYVPFEQPINTDYNPSTPCGKAQDPYYNTDQVQLNLLGGATDVQTYSPGPANSNPFYKTFISGPMNYDVDLSLFKVFPITQTVNLRFNVDAFNAFNVQGFNNPDPVDGIENMLTSHNTPRQIQLSLRLNY